MISLEEEFQPKDIGKPTKVWNPSLSPKGAQALEKLRTAYEMLQVSEMSKCLFQALYLYMSSGLPKPTWHVTSKYYIIINIKSRHYKIYKYIFQLGFIQDNLS